MTLLRKQIVQNIQTAQQRSRREQDREHREWINTPEGLITVLVEPAHGVAPSKRTRDDILNILQHRLRD
jgi:hypothetical protein